MMQSMDALPVVSVVLPSYNYARLISEAIASVQAQSVQDWELLIVDDGSTDDSLAVIRAACARDARIRLFTHERQANQGLAATLRRGLREARAPLAAFLEADDVFAPASLEEKLVCQRRTGAKVVFSSYALKAEDGVDTTSLDFLRDCLRWLYAFKTAPFALGSIELGGNVLPTFSCVLACKETLLACDFAPPDAVWFDWWLWCQLAHEAIFAYVDAPLTLWRLHGESYNQKTKNPALLRAAFARQLQKGWLGRHVRAGRWAFVLALTLPRLWHVCVKCLCLVRHAGLRTAVRYVQGYYSKRAAPGLWAG